MTTPLGPPTGDLTKRIAFVPELGPAPGSQPLTHEQALAILLDLLREADLGPSAVDLTVLPLTVLLAMDQDYRNRIKWADETGDRERAGGLFLRRLEVGREIGRRAEAVSGPDGRGNGDRGQNRPETALAGKIGAGQ